MTEKIKLSKAEYLAHLSAQRVYVPLMTHLHKALPNRRDLFAQPLYVWPNNEPARAGTNQPFYYNSRG